MAQCDAEIVKAGKELREHQIRLNDELKRIYDHLNLNADLQDQHRELREQIKAHGRAVRASVEAQNAADAALRRGDTTAARGLMETAESSLPDLSMVPDMTSRPASPPDKPVVKETKESAVTPPPPAPSIPDSSGMEERIKALFDQGFGAIRDQVDAVSLPCGYREVLSKYSPEDLERALGAGRWVNDRRGNPVKSLKESLQSRKQSRISHNTGVSEDGAPN
jgi:predicted transcriptional regulator